MDTLRFKGHSRFNLLVTISVCYAILLPVVLLFLFAGGVVQSDAGQSIPQLQFLGEMEQILALSLFISASISWAFYKYGLTRVAWTLLLVPLLILVSICFWLMSSNSQYIY